MVQSITSTRKDQIKEVAQNMFRERGYAATSMRDLAAAIGIEPASLYSHISSKESLLKEICFSIAKEFFEAIAPIQANDSDPLTKLESAIIAHVKVITNNVDAAAVFLHDWRHLSGPDLTKFKRMRHEYESFFREIIADGVKQGVFRDAGDKFMVLTLFSALNWIYDWYNPTGNLNVEEIAVKLGEIIINGFKNNTSS